MPAAAKPLRRYLAQFRALEKLYSGQRLEQESRRLMETILERGQKK